MTLSPLSIQIIASNTAKVVDKFNTTRNISFFNLLTYNVSKRNIKDVDSDENINYRHSCYLNHSRFGQNDTRLRNDKRHESSVVADNKDDDKVIHLNNFKNLHAKEFNPSDFFKSPKNCKSRSHLSFTFHSYIL